MFSHATVAIPITAPGTVAIYAGDGDTRWGQEGVHRSVHTKRAHSGL